MDVINGVGSFLSKENTEMKRHEAYTKKWEQNGMDGNEWYDYSNARMLLVLTKDAPNSMKVFYKFLALGEIVMRIFASLVYVFVDLAYMVFSTPKENFFVSKANLEHISEIIDLIRLTNKRTST